MSPSNGNYCKYYRINVSYCIQKNWYLSLYRKIKSLLYIQLMTGMRGLPWKHDYNIRTHNWRTFWFIDNNGASPCNAHAHLATCTTASHTHTSFLSCYFFRRAGNNTLNTAQITRMSWKVTLGRGSGVILISPCPPFQSITYWKFLLIC